MLWLRIRGCAYQRLDYIGNFFAFFLRNIKAAPTNPNTAINSALPPEVSGTVPTTSGLAEDVVAIAATATINRYRLNLPPNHNVLFCMCFPSMILRF